jgi:hypothetical protein
MLGYGKKINKMKIKSDIIYNINTTDVCNKTSIIQVAYFVEGNAAYE